VKSLAALARFVVDVWLYVFVDNQNFDVVGREPRFIHRVAERAYFVLGLYTMRD
jgi:hypothetical protein